MDLKKRVVLKSSPAFLLYGRSIIYGVSLKQNSWFPSAPISASETKDRFDRNNALPEFIALFLDFCGECG